jgi:hypothetical protein
VPSKTVASLVVAVSRVTFEQWLRRYYASTLLGDKIT